MDPAVRQAKTKNKNPSAIQITAEQILRESKDRQEKVVVPPKQRIADKEELDHYQLNKRKGFEDAVRRNRTAVGAWLKYAQWEEQQNELERSRSVFERSLDFEPRNQTIWLKYAEMEMKHKNVNRARNVFNRVIVVLPRVDLFWYKYTYMEELLDNVPGARQVFERWMEWEPTEDAWMAYVKFEQRYKEFELARLVFKKFVTAYPQPKNWLKWAKFEESNNNIDTARQIYEQCMQTLGEEYIDQNIYISFAKFETRFKQIDRARVIYKYAIDKLAEGQKENLYNVYTQFEKQHGGKEGLEDVVISKRRLKYEDEILANPYNYDVWFDYIMLEETHGKHEKIREVYERAISKVPLISEKQYWRRYIYLWIYYAVWEELEGDNMERAHQVWILYSKFLIRKMDLPMARKNMGMAVGLSAKEKTFKNYIELELSLREFDRVRTLFQKYLEWNAANCAAWIKFSELERMLGDTERCRAVFEIAAAQLELDMPEMLWKSYIDFEIGEMEWQRARLLYHRLLERTRHVKVYISLARFEYTALDCGDEQQRIAKTLAVFKETHKLAKDEFSKEDRVLLIDAWHEFSIEHAPNESSKINDLKPKVIKKRRRIEESGGWEEYFDYVFPDDASDAPNLKLLALAHEWKIKMSKKAAESDEEESDSD